MVLGLNDADPADCVGFERHKQSGPVHDSQVWTGRHHEISALNASPKLLVDLVCGPGSEIRRPGGVGRKT